MKIRGALFFGILIASACTAPTPGTDMLDSSDAERSAPPENQLNGIGEVGTYDVNLPDSLDAMETYAPARDTARLF